MQKFYIDDEESILLLLRKCLKRDIACVHLAILESARIVTHPRI